MKKIHLISFFLFYLLLNSCSNNLSCLDFKTGTFFIPENEDLLEYTIQNKDSTYSVKIERNKNISRYLVIRNEGTQTEWINGVGNGDPIYEKIEWISDCSYRLTYDDEKMELNEEQIYMNQNNGIVVEMTEFIGKCVKYKATSKDGNGEVITQKGIFCKE